MQRTITDFVNAAAAKFSIEPSKVVRTVRINQRGLRILLDDEAIRELPEGQDMKAEFGSADAQSPQQSEWHPKSHMDASSGYELKLIF